MLSLYIHIPFCHHKCSYCSFHVIPLNSTKVDEKLPHSGDNLETTVQPSGSNIIKTYLEALHRQIDHFANSPTHQLANSPKTQIKTIYFGGGTPSTIGANEMSKIIDHLNEVYDLEYLEELSIEINPEPVDEMLNMITTISKRYKHFPRVRFSIGIQSFDNEVLDESGRKYNFQSCVEFLRKLVPLKMDHNVFNLDFIAFGKFNKTRKGELQLRDPVRLQFFQNLAESAFIDSFSLYTLELFEGSERYNQQIPHYSHAAEGFGLKKYGSDDDVYTEFEILKGILLDAGFRRYEISNYSLAGKNSIHNRVYRSMGERLGLGTGATSHLRNYKLGIINDKGDETSKGTSKIHNLKSKISGESIISQHFTTTSSLKDFAAGNYIDEKKTELLTEHDYLKEKLLMGLRTMEGVPWGQSESIVEEQSLQDSESEATVKQPGNNFETILIENREEKVALYTEEGLCERDGNILKLNDTGMNVYNSFITEIMK